MPHDLRMVDVFLKLLLMAHEKLKLSGHGIMIDFSPGTSECLASTPPPVLDDFRERHLTCTQQTCL